MASSLRTGILKYDDEVPLLELRDQRLPSMIVLNSFFDRDLMSGASPVDKAEADDNAPLSEFLHQTIFPDFTQGEGFTINPRSILRMRIQRNKAV